MTLTKTYSPTNEARIVCPIFNAETKIADCFALEQQLARGQVQPERRGCQACLRSSKCPVYWINREIQREGTDPYHSAEPKVVSLKPAILDHIAPIVVQERHIHELGVQGEELDAIVAANDTTSSGAKRSKKAPAVTLGRVKAETRTPAAADTDDVTRAALSGDMSAAITKAAVGKPVTLDLSNVRPSGPPIAPEPKPEPAKVEAPKPKPAPKPAPAPAADAPKGLSLLERARLMAAQKAA